MDSSPWDVSCAYWNSCCPHFTSLGPGKWLTCAHMFLCPKESATISGRGRYLKCILLWSYHHTQIMTLLLGMFVESLPEGEMPVSYLSSGPGLSQAWIVSASLQGSTPRDRDILFPSLGAAKLPTQELKQCHFTGRLHHQFVDAQ